MNRTLVLLTLLALLGGSCAWGQAQETPARPAALTPIALPQSVAQHDLAPRDTLRLACWTTDQVLLNAVVTVAADGTLTPPGIPPLNTAGLNVKDLQDALLKAYEPLFPGATLLLALEGAAAPENEPGALTPAAADLLNTPLQPGAMLGVRCWTRDTVLLDVVVTVAPDATLALPPLGRLSVQGQTLLTLRNLLQARYRVYYPGCSLSVLLRGKSAPTPAEGMPTAPEIPVWQKFPPLTPAGEILDGLPRFGAAVFSGTAAPVAGILSPAAPAANLPVPADYLLGPGDKLTLRCWSGAVEHYSLEVVITPEGRIYVPQLGEMAVAGQTLAQLTSLLNQRSRRLYRDSQTTAVLAQIRTVDVYVTGDATTPGKYTLPGTATVFTALYAAGGPSPSGSLRHLRLVRKGQAPREIDLYPYLLTGDREADVPLNPGDTVFVGPLGPTVGISGLVRRPALYEMKEPLTCGEALALAGGLQPRAYGRNLELWRVDRQTAWNMINLDLGLPDDHPQGPGCKLQSGDLLLARPVLDKPANTVEVIGAVRRPGVYEVGAAGLDVKQLLEKAQGLDEHAYVPMATIWRLTPTNDYRLLRCNLLLAQSDQPEHNLKLQPGDKLYVYSRQDVLQEQQVSIQGAVAGPGLFPWAEQMRVSDLLLQARGLLDGAYTARADLRRLTPDFRREVLPVNLAAVLAGKVEADLPLQPGDQLVVFSQKEMGPAAEVAINGAVQRPGVYERTEGMKASDLILAAGGLLPAAGAELEHVKGRVVGTPVVTKLRIQSREAGRLVLDPDPVLADDDTLNVLGQGDFLSRAARVRVQGLVAQPGTYALLGTPQDPDTVYKLITRAGGLLPNANPRGIVLYRLRTTQFGAEQSEQLTQVLQGFNRERTSTDANFTPEQRAAGLSASLSGQIASVLGVGEGSGALVIPPRTLSAETWTSALPVDGEKLLATKGAEGDVNLGPDDLVVIPAVSRTIAVLGAVVRPGAVQYVGNKPPLEYVQLAGGATPDAVLRKLILVRANGAVVPATASRDVFPGDVIVVPSDYMVRHISATSQREQILRTLATVAAAFLIL